MTGPGEGFADPIIAGSGALIRAVIKSPNYVTGVSGWAIFANGNSEFNNGTFRGTVNIGLAPTGAGAIIGATIPPVLVTYYSSLFNHLSGFAELVYPGDGSFHYAISGRDTIQNISVWLEGWVSNIGTVVDNYESIVFNASGNQNQWFGTRMIASQGLFTQFGAGIGATKAFPDVFQVFDATIRFGKAGGADTGRVEVNVPMLFQSSAPATFNAFCTFNNSGAINNLTVTNQLTLPLTVTFGPSNIPMGGGILDAVNVATVGALTAAASAETNVPNLAFSAAVIAGRAYDLLVTLPLACSVITDDWVIRVRTTTALTGTVVAESDGKCATVVTAQLAVVYLPAATGTVNFFVSFLRRTGTGTLTANGSNAVGSSRAVASIRDCAPASSWRST